jgi:hypothetical protein
MLADLLRSALEAGDARALSQAVRAGLPGATPRPFDVAAALADAALSAKQQRAAGALALALLGVDACNADARLTRIAGGLPAFAADAALTVHDYAAAALAIQRDAPGGQRVLCLVNLADEEQLLPVPWRRVLGSVNVRDLVGGARLSVHGPSFALGPFDVRWLING